MYQKKREREEKKQNRLRNLQSVLGGSGTLNYPPLLFPTAGAIHASVRGKEEKSK